MVQKLSVATAPKTSTFQARINPEIKAVMKLMSELKKGEDSVKSETDWISQDDIMKEFA